MRIGLVASLGFHTHTGGRTRATKIYHRLARKHEVELLNVSRSNRAALPDPFDGRDFSATNQRLPGTVREVIAGLRAIGYCQHSGFDLVWSYHGWQHTPVVSWLASRVLDVPLIVGVNDHRSGSGIKGRIVNEWLRKRIYEAADALVLESATLRPGLRALDLDDERMVVVPTGIDIADFYRPEVPERDTPTVFYVGRDKDLDLLFESVPLVAQAVEDLECRVAGVAASDHPSVTDDRISFLGYVSDEQLRTEMAQSHVCVVPYREADTAGRPVKLLEYMSAGKCIVGTDLPFNAQMIRDGENGLLADPTPRAFAASLRRALTEPALREELATQARKDVETYSLETMDENLERAVSVATEGEDGRSFTAS